MPFASFDLGSPVRRISAWGLSLPLVAGLAACGEGKRTTGANEEGGALTAGDTEFGEEGGSDSGELKLDSIEGMDAGADCVDPTTDDDEFEFSVIWIANSVEDTVSKIDTIEAVELARYKTGVEGSDPSRTSVNLLGDVAVGNRGTRGETMGGFIKIHGDSENCVDQNNDGMIQTSSGPTDVLAWGQDECVAWSHVVDDNPYGDPGVEGPRGVAWDGGDLTQCRLTRKPAFWGGYGTGGGAPRAVLLNGDTGAVEETVTLDKLAPYVRSVPGTYGAAADADGNYYGIVGNSPESAFVIVDRGTFEHEVYGFPGWAYGFSLDANGDAWVQIQDQNVVVQINRFDGVSLHQFSDGDAIAHSRGAVIDRNGHLWTVRNRKGQDGNDACGLTRFDTVSRAVVDARVSYDGCLTPVGVSVDFQGYIWVVDQAANAAYKLEPMDSGASVAAVVEGLNEPYTYSDMTGAVLNLVTDPPIG